ncbi:MAG: hypothetical protein ACKOPE_11920 [Novosphingobium sp.]
MHFALLRASPEWTQQPHPAVRTYLKVIEAEPDMVRRVMAG